MNEIKSEIEVFMHAIFKNNEDISEIIIQNAKPTVFVMTNNKLTISKTENCFELSHVLDFSLSQNQVASKITPSIGGVIDKTIRWHLVMSPITVDTYCLQFRKINFESFNLKNILKKKTDDFLMRNLFKYHGCIIFGETSSGKSTLLHSIITEFHHHQRVLILENHTEISTTNPYWTNLNCFQDHSSKKIHFDYEYLLMQSQRLRPDVLVIGEITSFNHAFFKQLTHSGFQKIHLTIHGSQLADVVSKLNIPEDDLLDSFLVFKTHRNRNIQCLNEVRQIQTTAEDTPSLLCKTSKINLNT